MDTCPDWDQFCSLFGYSVYAVNEGGGEIEVSMTVQQACFLGIVDLPDYKKKSFEEAFPQQTSES